MIKAIIFDFDGVLTDNTDLIVKIYQEAAALSHRPIPSRKQVIAVLGRPGAEAVRRTIGRNPKFRETQIKIWQKYIKQEKLIPGIGSVFKKLKLKTAIVSSRSESGIDTLLGKFKKYFSVIISPDDTAKHKPNPEPLLLACKKLKIKPAEAVYVGDTLIDWQTAKKAGLPFIAMLSGAYTKNEFKKYKVKYFVKSLNDLPKTIERINL